MREPFKEVLVDLAQGSLKVTDRWNINKAMSILGEKSVEIFTRRYIIKTLERVVVGKTEIQHVEESKRFSVNILIHKFCAHICI